MRDGGDSFDSFESVPQDDEGTAPTPPSERLGRAIDPRLEQILMRCLAKDADDRPARAGEVARELEECGLVWARADAERWWATRPRGRRPGTEPTDRAVVGTMTVAAQRQA